MSDVQHPLALDVRLDQDADAAEIEQAVVHLRAELLELDVDAIQRPATDPPPADARSAEVALVSALLVDTGREAISAVIRTVQAWVARSSNRSVKVTLGDDCIELSNASDEEQRRLVESFLARHSVASP